MTGVQTCALPIYCLDQIETISDIEGFNYTRQLAREQGLLVGSSSGAAFAEIGRASCRERV